MADFDLTQTDAQVQSILNDGQNMQGAGAQTTLTTESVLLKDVNGNYHKILKSSFTEAIRDTLAGLLVNNDKGTTINQIAAIASGDFGSITPANLTSVLGGVNITLIYRKTPSGTKPYVVFDLTSFTNEQKAAYNLYGFNTNYSLFNLRLLFAKWNAVMLKVNGNLTHPQGTVKFYTSDSKIYMDTAFNWIYANIYREKIFGTDIPISIVTALPEGATEMTDI